MKTIDYSKHALLQTKITLLRDKKTPYALFARTMNEISTILCALISADLAVQKTSVQTPLMKAAGTRLKKPIVLEEFGLPRDHESYDPASPTTARDEYYRRMFDQVAESCRAGRALLGANFWAWAGAGRVAAKLGATSDSFTGDPFCEPQGLNSVFDTDRSTLVVIAKANEKLAALC